MLFIPAILRGLWAVAAILEGWLRGPRLEDFPIVCPHFKPQQIKAQPTGISLQPLEWVSL